jgi:hypothetical protein
MNEGYCHCTDTAPFTAGFCFVLFFSSSIIILMFIVHSKQKSEKNYLIGSIPIEVMSLISFDFILFPLISFDSSYVGELLC